MNIRRNMGIILMMFGVLLTIDQNRDQNELFYEIELLVQTYWPLIISFIGIYMISTPRKR
ncbi:MAG: hypothetical protein LUF02_09360 [Erysipelotrichaceae bacterium]|nr:hypothetical protein [Erysipelotrichaceae bacterium]